MPRAPPFSKDDDLLSSLLIDVALFKHTRQATRKMDQRWRPNKVDEERIASIIGDLKKTDDLDRACLAIERLPPCARNFRQKYESDSAQGAFRAHIRRYATLHMADAPFELFVTERYLFDPDAESELSSLSDSEYKEHRYWTWEKPTDEAAALEKTPPPPREGPLDLGVKSKEDFEKGDIIPKLLGRVHDLTDEQDEKLRAQTLDFSVTMNAGRGCFQALFGPARFVNHDCDANVELTRRGPNMCFEVVRPIKAGEEILSNYGDSYFGEGNRWCKCASCEKKGRGAFAKEAYIEKEVVLEELDGRVTRSKEVLVPLTRAERLEAEARQRKLRERAERLAMWARLGEQQRDLDREESIPSYLQPRFDKDENRLSREERSKRRAEGLPVEQPSPIKKRRASAPPVEPKSNVPGYIRLGVPHGNGDRSARSLRRLGIDLPTSSKGKKKEVRSLEQQIADMTAAIRASVQDQDGDQDDDTSNDEESVAVESPKPTVVIKKTAVRRVHQAAVDKPLSAPARLINIDAGRRSSRREAIVTSDGLSTEQQIAALAEATRASVLEAKKLARRVEVSSDRIAADMGPRGPTMGDFLSYNDPTNASDSMEVETLLYRSVREGPRQSSTTYTVTADTSKGRSAWALTTSGTPASPPALDSRSSVGVRVTRNTKRAAEDQLSFELAPPFKRSRKSALGRQLVISENSKHDSLVEPKSESDDGTPTTNLFDSRDGSLTSLTTGEEDIKMLE